MFSLTIFLAVIDCAAATYATATSGESTTTKHVYDVEVTEKCYIDTKDCCSNIAIKMTPVYGKCYKYECSTETVCYTSEHIAHVSEGIPEEAFNASDKT